MDTPIQEIPIHNTDGIRLFVKRDDVIHPFVSGNKFRKLKYNLIAAKRQKNDMLLTFGGAYSNHIAAVAYAGYSEGFKTLGIIRGEELVSKIDDNPTLRFAKQYGMQFRFVTRSEYRNRDSQKFQDDLKTIYDHAYLIPEGGTNTLAVQGCEEIISTLDTSYSHICCAVGTGGTISGLINASHSAQKVLGFPALKGNFLDTEIAKFAKQSNWCLVNNYHFGGYAKINEALVQFINDFKVTYGIALDPIYTGKMFFGIFDMLKKQDIAPQSKILAIHTGGLQGIAGMNLRLKSKGLPLIHV